MKNNCLTTGLLKAIIQSGKKFKNQIKIENLLILEDR